MKNTKYKVILLATLMSALNVACKRAHQPVGKSVYGTVDCKYEDGYKQNVYVNLENEESLLLMHPDKDYNVGDTVWFHYDENARDFGVIYYDMADPKPDFKDFVRKQQQEIYGKHR